MNFFFSNLTCNAYTRGSSMKTAGICLTVLHRNISLRSLKRNRVVVAQPASVDDVTVQDVHKADAYQWFLQACTVLM